MNVTDQSQAWARTRDVLHDTRPESTLQPTEPPDPSTFISFLIKSNLIVVIVRPIFRGDEEGERFGKSSYCAHESLNYSFRL